MKNSKTVSLKVALLACFSILLVSCSLKSTKSVREVSNQDFDPNSNLTPSRVQENVDYFQKAKQKPADLQNDYLLRVAYQLLNRNVNQQSQNILKSIDSNALPYYLKQRLGILQGYWSLNQNDIKTASELINQKFVFDRKFKKYNPLTQSWLLLIRAKLATKLNQTPLAIEHYIQRDALLPEKERYENEALLWSLLINQDTAYLESVHLSSDNKALSEWAKLALHFKTYATANPKTWELLVDQWYSNNITSMPLNLQLIEDIKEHNVNAIKINGPINQVTLLLPSKSKYKVVSDAIEKGFRDAAAFYMPQLQIRKTDYTNNTGLIQSSYLNPQKQGHLIIGPLGKAHAKTFAEKVNNVSIPTILLGKPPVDNIKNVIQFSLTPEDEVNAIIEKMIIDGKSEVIIVHPDTPKGNRLVSEFRNISNLSQLRVADVVKYDKSNYNTSQIKSRINSQYQIHGVKAAVFLVAESESARIIHSDYKSAFNDLTTYSTSSVYQGKIDVIQDRALNGIIFPEMPWMIKSQSFVPRTIQHDFNGAYTALDRYYAYGIDLLLITNYLSEHSTLKNNIIEGTTANLQANNKNKINRLFKWYQYIGAQPVAL